VFVIDEDNNTLMKTITISKFSCRININAIIKPSCSLAIDENKNKIYVTNPNATTLSGLMVKLIV